MTRKHIATTVHAAIMAHIHALVGRLNAGQDMPVVPSCTMIAIMSRYIEQWSHCSCNASLDSVTHLPSIVPICSTTSKSLVDIHDITQQVLYLSTGLSMVPVMAFYCVLSNTRAVVSICSVKSILREPDDIPVSSNYGVANRLLLLRDAAINPIRGAASSCSAVDVRVTDFCADKSIINTS